MDQKTNNNDANGSSLVDARDRFESRRREGKQAPAGRYEPWELSLWDVVNGDIDDDELVAYMEYMGQFGPDAERRQRERYEQSRT